MHPGVAHPRVFVFGGSGLVGSHIVAEARRRGCEVAGTSHSHEVPGLQKLDLADLGAAFRMLAAFGPNWVVYAAGWTWVDGCEKDPSRAFRENSEIPAALAKECRKLGSRFVYPSSTYVFDGRAGPYGEFDSPNPVNVYGRSKLAGEEQVQAAMGGKALLPRLICVWGKELAAKNFVYQVLRSLRNGETMNLPSDQYGNPTWAGDIAAWLFALMEKESSGVWNLASSESDCSREAWFCAIRDAARARGLVPDSASSGYRLIDTKTLAQPAPRPLHAGARVDRLKAFLPFESAMPARLDLLL